MAQSERPTERSTGARLAGCQPRRKAGTAIGKPVASKRSHAHVHEGPKRQTGQGCVKRRGIVCAPDRSVREAAGYAPHGAYQPRVRELTPARCLRLEQLRPAAGVEIGGHVDVNFHEELHARKTYTEPTSVAVRSWPSRIDQCGAPSAPARPPSSAADDASSDVRSKGPSWRP
jgi:hypothetical protein